MHVCGVCVEGWGVAVKTQMYMYLYVYACAQISNNSHMHVRRSVKIHILFDYLQ